MQHSRKLVRHSSARVVAAIASIELSEGTWPQLFPFIEGACTAPDVQTREVGSYLLFAVLESFGEGIGEHMQSFFKIFEILLQDPESIEVRVTAAKSVSHIQYNRYKLITLVGRWVSSHNISMQTTRRILQVIYFPL